MKTNLLLGILLCLSISIEAQSGLIYYPGMPTTAFQPSADGNLFTFGYDYLTKTTLDGALIWQTPELITVPADEEAEPAPGASIRELPDGRILLFSYRGIIEISPEGVILSETILTTDDDYISVVQEDEHGFQLIIVEFNPIIYFSESFVHKAFTYALEERFSHPYIIESRPFRMAMQCNGATTSLSYISKMDEYIHEYFTIDTLGTLINHSSYVTAFSPVYGNVVYNNQFITFREEGDVNRVITAYDANLNTVWTETISSGHLLDSVMEMTVMPSGNMMMINSYAEFSGDTMIGTQKLEFFSPTGEHLGSSAEFLRSKTVFFYPTDIKMLDDNTVAISATALNTYDYSSDHCMIYVDTTGAINVIYYSGLVYHDANGNLAYDFPEPTLPFPSIDVTGIPFPIIGDANGVYNYISSGATEITASRTITPYWDITEPEAYTYPIATPAMYGSLIENQDFRIDFTTPAMDLEVSIYDQFSELPVVGADTTARYVALSANNVGNQEDPLAWLTVELEDYMHIESTTPPAFSVVDNVVKWKLLDFAPLSSRDFRVDYTIIFDAALVGTMYTLNAEITSSGIDVFVPNNTSVYFDEYEYAFDPNNIIVNPQGEGSTGLIDVSTEWLQYTINFQNTGTANAVNVVLMDTLDMDVDPASFTVLNHTDPVQIEQLDTHVFKFTFAGIQLTPDTEDYENSYGSITYKVKINPGSPIGTVITNNAGIYFDLNAPVITNTVMNTLDIMETVAEPDMGTLSVYPNPAQSVLHVSIPEHLVNAKLLSISSVDGRLVYQQQNPGTGIVEVSVSQLTPGLYIISCDAFNTSFIKQ